MPGLEPATLTPASEDASFRRYYRVESSGGTRIVMDAPPELEDCGPFIRVAGFLERMGLNSPRVLAKDLNSGFLLLSDLGSTLYLTELRNDRSRADRLYSNAISALAKMQKFGTRYQSKLPLYDGALLSFELSLFRDWLCERHLEIEFSASDEAQWQVLCRVLIDNALQQPKVFVHRDYHSRNLMAAEEDNPGILDFQDAVEGPLTYDLVSLLRDCYIRWPEDQVERWAMRFYDQLDDAVASNLSEELFMRYFDLMGVQRHLKASGIFARLLHRDGKAGYLPDVPRTLGYILPLGEKYDELSFLTDLVRNRCFPMLRESM